MSKQREFEESMESLDGLEPELSCPYCGETFQIIPQDRLCPYCENELTETINNPYKPLRFD